MSPLVRVVMPAYNRSFCVHEALRSVLDQSFNDFEVLVADDGSTDATAQVIKDYSAMDARIRLVLLQHGGAASARNVAIQAPGDYKYVAFLDSDDIWFPTHLERAIEILHANAGIGVYFSAIELEDIAASWSHEHRALERQRLTAPIRMADKSLGSGFHLLHAETCRSAFMTSKFVPMTPTVVVRREAVARAPWFNPDLTVMEDSDLFLFLAGTGQAYVFDERVHVRVRRLGNNLSQALSTDAMVRRLNSAWHYESGKLPFCRSHKERTLVSGEIASIETQLAHYAELPDLKAAR